MQYKTVKIVSSFNDPLGWSSLMAESEALFNAIRKEYPAEYSKDDRSHKHEMIAVHLGK